VSSKTSPMIPEKGCASKFELIVVATPTSICVMPHVPMVRVSEPIGPDASPVPKAVERGQLAQVRLPRILREPYMMSKVELSVDQEALAEGLKDG
jgi:hypothetical protein